MHWNKCSVCGDKRLRIRFMHLFKFLSCLERRMGGVSEGDDVLARWSDGLLYLGNVKRVDGVKQCCLVRFEDNSEFWVLRKDIHSFAAGVEEVCCICDAPPLKEPLINCLKCRHGKEACLIMLCQTLRLHQSL
ncbi:hypothetical protein ATANTOWER_001503 [Ataeniobius toweri]|uniref:Tudor domain-containing protein n=1 Tax=Ataeniobius toweri TaxID=208326 RepID=A0ABU7A0Z2_9TELE|nr:hypothetical protein [Ataeniobius toweri]